MNRYVRNLLLVPLLWAVPTMFVATLLGIEPSWRLFILLCFAQLCSDFLDFAFEGRPLMGPRRWK